MSVNCPRQLEELWIQEDIRDNPSAVFPDTKEWCIVTNNDSDVTYIRESQELISALTSLEGCDVYQIEPKSNN
ncbi:hypothetical protein HQN86_24455 [Pedobacter panaciterrae]|uniref:hypothetical protein n=1 Tax=Pedobacter panaciterrae TaxID=363849 RepID=UPI00155DA8AA|nr:hypothetical protein [Pedobacter panaciterrae]NQX56792.1 hypothetical protein [Pedobacter panaciterrae]